MTAATESLTLEGVTYREGDWFVAVCVNRFFVTCSRTEEDLESELKRCILAHIEIALEHDKEPFSDLHPAPPKYQRMLADARRAPRPGVTIEALPGVQSPYFPSVTLLQAAC